MKVESKQEKPPVKFEPVVLTVTLHSREEVKAVRALLGGTGVKSAIAYSNYPEASPKLAHDFSTDVIAHIEKFL